MVTEKNKITAGHNDHNGMRGTTKNRSSRAGAADFSFCCCSSSCSCCWTEPLPVPAAHQHVYDSLTAPCHFHGNPSAGRDTTGGSPDHCDYDDDHGQHVAAGAAAAASSGGGVLVPAPLPSIDDHHHHGNHHGNHNDDHQDYYHHQHDHDDADHDHRCEQQEQQQDAPAPSGATAGATGISSTCAPAQEKEAGNEERKNETNKNMNNKKRKINPDVMIKTKVDIRGDFEDHSKILIAVPQSSSAFIQPAAHSLVHCTSTCNMHIQEESTKQIGKRVSVLVDNSRLEFLNSKTKRLKLSTNELEILEDIDLKQVTSENNSNACNRSEDGCNIESNTMEKGSFISTSKIADCERSMTSLNLTNSANSFLESFRRRTDTTKLSPGLIPPTYPKRRSATSIFLLPAILLGAQDENSAPDALTHIPTTEKIDIFNRKTGRIMKGVPIAQLPPLLRDHAEYEPIYFGKVKKQPNALYRVSRTSPGGRVSAEVQPQTTMLCTKNIGDIVLVINGTLKGTWGKIVSHIPGNWLIIRRCFSFDGNDNVDIIVHSKNVKLRPKHKDTVIRKGVKSNAISSAQNKMSEIIQKVSDFGGKIQDLEKTSSGEICN